MLTRTALIILAAIFSASLACAVTAAFYRAQERASTLPAVERATTSAEVLAIDLKRGMLLVKHQPIPQYGMPDMTMSFAVEQPGLLVGRDVGEHVVLRLQRTEGMPVVVGFGR